MTYEVFWPKSPDLSKMSPWERKEYEDSKKGTDIMKVLLDEYTDAVVDSFLKQPSILSLLTKKRKLHGKP